MQQVVQPGFESPFRMAQKNIQPFLKIGRVIKVNAAQKTVDVAFMDGSGICRNITVLGSVSGTGSGTSYLPDPHVEDENDNLPKSGMKRDIFAIVGYIHGRDALPVVLGFKYPEFNQLSFPNKEGFENQLLSRHESDRYHRIIGDTLKQFGGTDAPCEEELVWPDGSYFKVYHDSKALTDLSEGNSDSDCHPFQTKKEERKGVYFQHSSGTMVLIDPNGNIKISHQSGSWVSIAPDTGNIEAEALPSNVINSASNPPTSPSSSPVQVHIEHSSGTKVTVKTSGDIAIDGVGKLDILTVGDIGVVSATKISIEAPEVSISGY